jgi:hypothetical protein
MAKKQANNYKDGYRWCTFHSSKGEIFAVALGKAGGQ